MICNRIKAADFRNIENETVSFSDGVNLLYGNNAEGKTNLLEAIYYVAIAKSFRGAKSGELLRFGQKSAELVLDFTDSLRKQNIEMRIFEKKPRTFSLNGCRVEKLSSLVGAFRAVLFCPEHLSIVKEGPSLRRNYLDIAICQLRPLYLKSLQRYNQILKQRNALLKNAESDPGTFQSTIEYWSLGLAKEAAAIAKARLWYVKSLDKYAKECFSDMTGGREVPSFTYAGNARIEEDGYQDTETVEKTYASLLLSSHTREIAAGSTLFGTHLDDISIALNGKPARLYASQGQQRSLALAMKLSEGEISRKETTEYPVFLFDDVLSELDAGRRAYLLSRISGRQVILTACDAVAGDTVAHEFFASSGKIIRVENGHYSE